MPDADRTASLMTPAKLAQGGGRAPVSPSAWLDRMATDAGHQHVRRLGELRSELRDPGCHDIAPLVAAVARLCETLARLDFGLLQKRGGLLARLVGRAKGAAAGFALQYDEIEAASGALAGKVQALQGGKAVGTDLALLEFEVEFRALDKIIDQGARWLQDMRNQLKAREAQGGDAAASDADKQRCDLLVGRLKALRALNSAAHESHERARAAAARRASVVQLLQKTAATQLKQWRGRIAPLADAARAGEPAPGLDAAMDCHRDLQLALKQAGADCTQLQAHDKALAESLTVLDVHLQPAT